jgi:hypothetical protein
VRGCGKTTALAVIEQLAYRPERMDGATPAVLFHIIDRLHGTLLVDEADNLGLKANGARGRSMRPRWRDFPNASAGRVAATFHQGQESHGAALILSFAKRPEGQRWIPPSGDRFPVLRQAG